MKSFEKILEAMSEEDIDKYFPKNWDPREGGREWETSPNPDDYGSILYQKTTNFVDSYGYLKNEEIGKMVANAFRAGNKRGFENAKSSFKEKTFDDIYRLNEMAYNSRRFYYHISPNKFTQFEKRNSFRKGDDTFGGVFLTPHLTMIHHYLDSYLSTKFDQYEFYVYKCLIIKQPNIFNPSNRKDREKFLIEVRKNPEEFYENYAKRQYKAVMNNLQKELDLMFSSHDWNYMENPEVTKIIKRLEYDGYVSKENDIGNIMLFDPSLIKIVPYDNKNDEIYKELDTRKLLRLDSYLGKKGCWTSQEWDEIKSRIRSFPDNFTRKGAFNKKEFKDLKNVTDDLLSIKTQDKQKQYSLINYFDEETGKLKQHMLYELMDILLLEKEQTPFIFQGEEYNSIEELESGLIKKYGIIDKVDEEDPEYKEEWDA